MSLLSTLSTALDVAISIRERRRGHDPSEQQSFNVVVPHLLKDIQDLATQLTALRASSVASEREAREEIQTVRQMNELLILAGIDHRLIGMHQRLMSLFPAVSEDLVEAARKLITVCSDLRERDAGDPETTSRFVYDATRFLAWSSREIKLLAS